MFGLVDKLPDLLFNKGKQIMTELTNVVFKLIHAQLSDFDPEFDSLFNNEMRVTNELQMALLHSKGDSINFTGVGLLVCGINTKRPYQPTLHAFWNKPEFIRQESFYPLIANLVCGLTSPNTVSHYWHCDLANQNIQLCFHEYQHEGGKNRKKVVVEFVGNIVGRPEVGINFYILEEDVVIRRTLYGYYHPIFSYWITEPEQTDSFVEELRLDDLAVIFNFDSYEFEPEELSLSVSEIPYQVRNETIQLFSNATGDFFRKYALK